VAVKILPPEVGADPAFTERFMREARALAKLSHQNIVSVFDFGQANGLYYIVMEFVDGANLRHVIETKAIKPEEALAIVPQVCEALQFAHNEGIVHRDIKPENILLDRQGRVKIADFGLAKLLDQTPDDFTLTGTNQAMGTLHYMAPEQMRGAALVDHRADIYSLGVVFYEMLTGQLPIGRFEPPSKKVHVDVRLDEVVLRSLESDPERRYQSISDVKTDLESVAGTHYGQGAVPRSKASDRHDIVRMQLRAPAIGLLVAGVINCLAGLLGIVMIALKIWGSSELAIVAGGAAIGILLIVASLKLLNMRAYGLIVTAAIIGLLPCTVGSLISLPFGIWILIVLVRRETAESFGVPVDHDVGSVALTEKNHNTSSDPRFSRKAMVGAFWAPLFFITMVSFFWTSTVRIPQSGGFTEGVHSQPRVTEYRDAESANAARKKVVVTDRPVAEGPAWWQWVLIFTMLPLGLLAPFGTTILGCVAISNIRHSRGRLIGLPLAVADTLFFPLLLLDSLIFALFVYGFDGFDSTNPNNMRMAIVLAVLVAAAADFFITRSVWRTAADGLRAMESGRASPTS
jgi:hypothetical protein